ncbi:cation:proton antiporter regulatory subunit [Halobacteriales archaeon Cl-PHB]
MTIYETEVPGVGHKYELELEGEARLVVIVHHDGKREVYRRSDPDADSEKLFSLDGKQGRQLGAILEGAYFQPLELEEVKVPVGEAVIEWTDVDEDSAVAGKTLADSAIRQETGVSVVAIQRGDQTLANPEPDERIEAGDVLVTLGTRAEQDDLDALLVADGD